MDAGLLPSATPKSAIKWAVGSVVIVIFALVVLNLLAQRGYDPVGYIARMIPMPARRPTVGANGSTADPASAGAAAMA